MAEQRDKSRYFFSEVFGVVILSKSLYALSCSSVEPQYGSSNRINCLTCDVIFCGSSAIASIEQICLALLIVIDSHLDITSDHRPGSALVHRALLRLISCRCRVPLNGYLRKGRKMKPKRQNRTRNGKAWKRQSQDKAQV
ncbi:hypothetical protein Tco_0238101 [Tanacetum coccineum]